MSSEWNNGSWNASSTSGGLSSDALLLIGLYSSIFVLSVVGNALVIATLARNRRMRTVTNAFLLNLAVGDLLLGVFCMPVTLVGSLLRNFIFGEVVCRLINYIAGRVLPVAIVSILDFLQMNGFKQGLSCCFQRRNLPFKPDKIPFHQMECDINS